MVSIHTYRDGLNARSDIRQTSHGPIEVSTTGTGFPVIALHGTPGGHDQGALVGRPSTENGVQLIAPSRPGYLRTPLDSGRTFESQADLVVALLDELDLEKAIIVGISGGGPPALQVALRHPERAAGLIMVSAVSKAIEDHFMGTGHRLLDRLLFTSPMLSMRDVVNQLGLRYQPEQVVDSLLSSESTLDAQQRISP
ncbi:alpha/beta fold hydrolase [Halococcus hamelinensis]|uniref:alpha/beta fold hydrolase n=1 Tax=Halococcus hamelinensis TaxID=332168 RepID=UPI0009A142E6